MSLCDGPAMDIDLLDVDVQHLGVGEGSHCEGLVDLPEVDVVGLQSREFKQTLDGIGRRDGEVHGVDSGVREVNHAGQRLQVVLLHLLLAHEDKGNTSVVGFGGVGGRKDTILLEGRAEGGDLRLVVAFLLLILADLNGRYLF